MGYLDRGEAIATRRKALLPAFFYDVRAMARAKLGQVPEALNDFNQAIQLVANSGDIENALRVWNNYGCYASWLGHGDDAVVAYGKTLELCEAEGFFVRTAFSALGLARHMVRLGKLTEARGLVHLALERGVSTPLTRLVLAEVGNTPLHRCSKTARC